MTQTELQKPVKQIDRRQEMLRYQRGTEPTPDQRAYKPDSSRGTGRERDRQQTGF